MIQNKCKIIGLTGGIASGKSTVSNILKGREYIVIDSDIIARKVVEIDKPSYYKVIEYFGDIILHSDKNIDRKKLSSIVFNNPKERKKLEDILYPNIFKEILEQIHNKCIGNVDTIFIDIPLLFENYDYINKSGINFDEIWLVYCDRLTQVERLTRRDDIGEENANIIIDAQMDIEEKKKMADVIIDNTKTKKILVDQIDKCLLVAKRDKI